MKIPVEKTLQYYIDYWISMGISEEFAQTKGMWSYRNRCRYFNNKIRKYLIDEHTVCKICASSNNLTLDHIIPVSKGGRNILENIQVLCNTCNCKKFNKI